MTDIAPNAGQTQILASAIAYHPFGTIKRWTDGAGQTHTRSQDLDGRIDAYTLESTLWRIYYDSAGRLIAESDAQGNIRREYLWLEETPLAIVQ